MFFSNILGDKLKNLFCEIRLGKRGETTRGKEDLDNLKFEILNMYYQIKSNYISFFFIYNICVFDFTFKHLILGNKTNNHNK